VNELGNQVGITSGAIITKPSNQDNATKDKSKICVAANPSASTYGDIQPYVNTKKDSSADETIAMKTDDDREQLEEAKGMRKWLKNRYYNQQIRNKVYLINKILKFPFLISYKKILFLKFEHFKPGSAFFLNGEGEREK
jgi:hypothetical protein